MKKLISLIALTFSLNTFAHELPVCDPPKVVKKARRKKRKAKPPVQQTVVQPVIEHHHFSYREIYLPPKANRFFVIAGDAPKGIATKTTGNTKSFSLDRGAVLGVGYERILDIEASDSLVMGVDVLTNGSVLFKLGQDF